MPLFDRTQIWKFGGAPNIQVTDAPVDIWSLATDLYPFQSGPITLVASSSNAGDTGVPIFIEGLNENGLVIREIVVLNGTTPVAVPGYWLRQHRASCIHSTPFLGDVYVAETGDTYTTPGIPDTYAKTKIKILTEFQQSTMLIFTTPRDWISTVEKAQVSLVPTSTLAEYVRVGIFMRPEGGTFTCQGYAGLSQLGTSFIDPTFEGSSEIPPMTDIVIRALTVSANGMEITGSFSCKRVRKLEL